MDDSGTQLVVEYVLEDPDYLGRPVAGQFEWRFAPDMDFNSFSCDREVARRYLRGEQEE